MLASKTDMCLINRANTGALYYREVMVFASGTAAILGLLTLATLMKKTLGKDREGMASDAISYRKNIPRKICPLFSQFIVLSCHLYLILFFSDVVSPPSLLIWLIYKLELGSAARLYRLVDEFLYSRHQSDRECLNTVRRNKFSITLGLDTFQSVKTRIFSYSENYIFFSSR